MLACRLYSCSAAAEIRTVTLATAARPTAAARPAIAARPAVHAEAVKDNGAEMALGGDNTISDLMADLEEVPVDSAAISNGPHCDGDDGSDVV